MTMKKYLDRLIPDPCLNPCVLAHCWVCGYPICQYHNCLAGSLRMCWECFGAFGNLLKQRVALNRP